MCIVPYVWRPVCSIVHCPQNEVGDPTSFWGFPLFLFFIVFTTPPSQLAGEPV